jgi:hypothetical protein
MTPIGIPRLPLQHKFLNHALHACRDLLTDVFIAAAARACGMVWRDRLFNPVVTLLSCIYAHLGGVSSLRVVEDWINTFDPDVWRPADGSAFAKARLRLPLALFERCGRQLADAASQAGGLTAFGLRVVLADGTGLRMGRTPANVDHFGRHANQHGPSRRPVAQAFLICCAGTGAVLSWAMAPFAWSERRLLYRMLRELGPGCLLVGDAGLFSYVLLSRLKRFGSHALVRLPAWKSSAKSRKRLARGDHLEVWKRPRPVHSLFPKLLRREPERLKVRVIAQVVRRRGYRDFTLRLVTTLIDAPADELVSLYASRWGIELDIRELKRTHLPKVLRGLSPKSVLREFASGVMAFNVVRALAALAADRKEDVRRISHTRASRAIVEWSAMMRQAPAARLPILYQGLLTLIGRMTQKKQQRLPEPRAVIPLPRRYPNLNTTRQHWKSKHAA